MKSSILSRISAAINFNPLDIINAAPSSKSKKQIEDSNGTLSPVTAGRSSLPVATGIYGGIIAEMAEILPEFNLELIKVCEHLAKHNGDISYAVDNIVQLGNTPYRVTFDQGVKEDQAKEMNAYLIENTRTIYPGGMRALINDLLAQAIITGAYSTEWIPDKTLSKIERAVLVAPLTIRFRYNENTYTYDPYQTLNGTRAVMDTSSNLVGLKKLNPVTYRYLAMRRINDNPYGIPALIASFEMLEVEKDSIKSLKHAVRKMGLFGFLTVMTKVPFQKQGEKDAEYYARITNYLNSLRPEIEKGYANGIAIGVKDNQEIKVEGNNSNLLGAKEVIELISQMKMAGMKQDPLMLGRNFNVAETMARVIMAKLTTQVANYQAMLASIVEDLFRMILVLGGFSVSRVNVKFDPPMIGDRFRDAQAKALEIENAITMRDAGIIGQQDAAQELKVEEPYAEKNQDYGIPVGGTKINKKDPSQAADPTASGSTNYSFIRQKSAIAELGISMGAPVFPYECDCEVCKVNAHTRIDYAKKNKTQKKVADYEDEYASATLAVYQQALDKIAVLVTDALALAGNGASLQQVTDKVFYVLYNNWTSSFTEPENKIIKKWVSEVYTFFRNDYAVFDGKIKDIPEGTFDLFDIRALTYFERVDALYLGKFITDPDTKKRLTSFLKKQYLENSMPIGDNAVGIEMFRQQFTSHMRLEDWKIRRIIDTSVNKMRNFAAVSYMNQAGVKHYTILGINDERRCEYCRHMDGQIFTVSTAAAKFDKIVQGMPENINFDAPFATSVFKGKDGIERFKQLDGEGIQAAGIDIGQTHPNCRCVAVMLD